MTIFNRVTRGLTVAGLMFAASSCADQLDDAVFPNIVTLDGQTESLTAGSVTAVNGTYTSCIERSGSWSIRVSGAAPLDYDPLSVVKGDTGCSLAITEIVADQKYTTAGLLLTASYQASSAAFAPSGGGATAFYANSKLDTAGFGGNFAISLVYSGSPVASDAGNVSATYATVQASGQATVVPAPDYTISFTAGTPLTVQFDATKTVTSVSGNASLTDGLVTGTTYVVDQGTLGANPNYLAVQVAYLLGPLRTISGANPTIPAAHFGLTNVSLATPVVRTVIIGNAIGSVLGYQLIKVTFKSP